MPEIYTLPIFETKRLILRAVEESDAPAYQKHFVDYEVVPKQYEQLLKQELNKKSFVFDKAEFTEEKTAEHTHII